MEIIAFQDFSKIEICVGRIIKIEEFPRAINPSYKIWADFGEKFGELQTSAQVKINYEPDELLNKLIIGVLNFQEKNIAGFKSQFLLLGFRDDKDAIILAVPDKQVSIGSKIC